MDRGWSTAASGDRCRLRVGRWHVAGLTELQEDGGALRCGGQWCQQLLSGQGLRHPGDSPRSRGVTSTFTLTPTQKLCRMELLIPPHEGVDAEGQRLGVEGEGEVREGSCVYPILERGGVGVGNWQNLFPPSLAGTGWPFAALLQDSGVAAGVMCVDMVCPQPPFLPAARQGSEIPGILHA